MTREGFELDTRAPLTEVLQLNTPIPGTDGRIFYNPHTETLPFDGSNGTLVTMSGPSGSGKDTIREGLPLARPLQTAVSRNRRESGPRTEPEDAYLWMRPPTMEELPPGWTINEKGLLIPADGDEEVLPMRYMEALAQEYGLVEMAYHFGAVYGLPLENLQQALAQGETIPVSTTELNGVRTLKEHPDVAKIANLLCLFVLPGSIEELQHRLITLGQEDWQPRVAKAHEEIAQSMQLADLYIHNPEGRLEEVIAAVNIVFEQLLAREYAFLNIES